MLLKGQNFQSLETFDLDISGLTVLVGPSNKGKSAVFRALRGLFRNELPVEFIRTGSSGLELTATVDGKVITARRTSKGSTQYEIDGKEFKKLAKTVPPELAAFAMNPVEIGEYTLDPIFAKQNGKQFLIDPEEYGPTEINTILGAFASTEKLEAGKGSANLEIKQKNSEARVLAEEINTAEGRRVTFRDLSEAAEFIAADLEPLIAGQHVLESKCLWLKEAHQRQSALWPIQAALEKLSIPDTAEIERLTVAAACAVDATNSFRRRALYKRTLDTVEAINTQWTGVFTLKTQLEGITELQAASSAHVSFPLQPITDAMEKANAGIAVVQSALKGIILLGQLSDSLEIVSSTKGKVIAIDAEIADLVEQQSAVRKQIADEQLIACPECGHKFELSGE